MNLLRRAIPGVAVAGIALALALGVDRALRLADSDILISASNSALTLTPDALAAVTIESARIPEVACETTARGVQSWARLFAGDSSRGVVTVHPLASVCQSTAESGRVRDAQNMPKTTGVIEVKRVGFNRGFEIDTVSSVSEAGGRSGDLSNVSSRPVAS